MNRSISALTWTGTRRWRAAKAGTMRTGALLLTGPPAGFSVNGDPSGGRSGQRRDPGREAALEAFSAEAGEDILKAVMRGRAVAEGTEPAEEIRLLLDGTGDTGEGVRAREDREQTHQQDLIERIHHLAALARIGQVFEMAQENNKFVKSQGLRRRVRHDEPPPIGAKDRHDPEFVTRFFTRLPWVVGPLILPSA